MSKHVRCSNCGKVNKLNYEYYWTNLAYFQCATHDELNQKYICRKCRKLLKPSSLYETPEYKELRHVVQEEVNEALRRGLNNNIVRQNFIQNIKTILDRRNIHQYYFQVTNDELIGIILPKIAFFGDVFVPIKTRKKTHGNRQ